MIPRLNDLLNPAKSGPLVQFLKYAICGGLATAVNVVVLFAASWVLFPCLTPEDPFVKFFAFLGVQVPTPDLTQEVRAHLTELCSIPAFILSNIVCYILNVLFVFRAGRHHRSLEFLLFLGASAFAAFLGMKLSGILVRDFNMAFSYASAANIVTAVLVNYIARKKIVFKG